MDRIRNTDFRHFFDERPTALESTHGGFIDVGGALVPVGWTALPSKNTTVSYGPSPSLKLMTGAGFQL
jgi:hypothetical protein